MDIGTCDIVERDPRQGLLAAAQSSAGAGEEQRRLQSEQTAQRAEHDPGADRDPADSGVLDPGRRLLPFLTELGEEPVPGRPGLVNRFVRLRPVVADGRGADEDRGPFGLGQAAHGFGEQPGRIDA